MRFFYKVFCTASLFGAFFLPSCQLVGTKKEDVLSETLPKTKLTPSSSVSFEDHSELTRGYAGDDKSLTKNIEIPNNNSYLCLDDSEEEDSTTLTSKDIGPYIKAHKNLKNEPTFSIRNNNPPLTNEETEETKRDEDPIDMEATNQSFPEQVVQQTKTTQPIDHPLVDRPHVIRQVVKRTGFFNVNNQLGEELKRRLNAQKKQIEKLDKEEKEDILVEEEEAIEEKEDILVEEEEETAGIVINSDGGSDQIEKAHCFSDPSDQSSSGFCMEDIPSPISEKIEDQPQRLSGPQKRSIMTSSKNTNFQEPKHAPNLSVPLLRKEELVFADEQALLKSDSYSEKDDRVYVTPLPNHVSDEPSPISKSKKDRSPTDGSSEGSVLWVKWFFRWFSFIVYSILLPLVLTLLFFGGCYHLFLIFYFPTKAKKKLIISIKS